MHVNTQVVRSVAVLVALLAAPGPGATQEISSAVSRGEAITAFQQGDLARAESLSVAWLETHPKDEEIQRLLGMVRITAALALEGAGAPRDEYLAAYRRARGPLLESERLAGGRPGPDVNHALGYILMIEGRFTAASSRLSRAIAETPDAFVLHRLRGSCRLELGQYIEAEADLRRAVELDGRDWTSRVLHGRALHLVGQGRAARDGLREYARGLDAGAPAERRFEALYETYRYSMLLNDTDAARSELEEACGVAPGNLVCRTELGILYYRLGDGERAIPELDAVREAAGAPRALRSDALHYRGLIARQQGELDLARRCLGEALELSPTRSDTLLSYGSVLRALGETEEAREVLVRFQNVVEVEKAAKRLTDRLVLDPSERDARVELIGLWIGLGRWPEAREQLEELRRRHPEDPSLRRLEEAIQGAGARALPAPS